MKAKLSPNRGCCRSVWHLVRIGVFAFGMAVSTGLSDSVAESRASLVYMSPARSLQWQVVRSREVSLRWHLPTGAVRTSLVFDDGRKRRMDFVSGETSFDWTVAGAGDRIDERVVTLTLTHYDSRDVVLGAETGVVAVVNGAFTPADALIGEAVDDATWPTVVLRKGRRIPLPADAKWSGQSNESGVLSICPSQGAAAGVPITSSQWIGWAPRETGGYGAYLLELAYGGSAVASADVNVIGPVFFLFLK